MSKSYFDLNDDILRTSLRLLPKDGRLVPTIVGGLAIQLHAKGYTPFLRDTPDLDLITGDNVSYEDFDREFFTQFRNRLIREGYKVQPKRGRNNHSSIVLRNPNKPNEEKFLVHLTNFSPEVYLNFKDYVKKQIGYQKAIEVPGSKIKVNVASLEEIIPLKIQRSYKYGVGAQSESIVGPAYGVLLENAKKGNWGALTSVPLGDWKTIIERMQQNLDSGGVNALERTNTYKLAKDVFDLCLTARVISDSMSTFDKDRFDENVQRILCRK
ncbi:MAG: hypothetical protein AABX11_00475 [Nanoarchaeota archaeon]